MSPPARGRGYFRVCWQMRLHERPSTNISRMPECRHAIREFVVLIRGRFPYHKSSRLSCVFCREGFSNGHHPFNKPSGRCSSKHSNAIRRGGPCVRPTLTKQNYCSKIRASTGRLKSFRVSINQETLPCTVLNPQLLAACP
jgi:hypothetical protein